jgi:hypothetical protein
MRSIERNLVCAYHRFGFGALFVAVSFFQGEAYDELSLVARNT